MIDGRMSKLEEDVKRIKYKNMSSDTLKRNAKQKDDKEKEIKDKNEKDESPAARKRNEDDDENDGNMITRQNSWANEVEIELENREYDNTMEEVDRAQWINKQRKPACWTDGLRATVKQNKEPEKEKLTKITDDKKTAVKHWFGYDATDDEEIMTEDDEKEKTNEWTTIERKEKRKEKERKKQRKRKERKEETARKAQAMIGLGPINWDSYEKEIKKEKNYEKVKLNLVNEHLRKYYKYDEDEIKQVEILETKITVKDEIFIYIVTKNNIDIKDIYRRKAEIRRDDIYIRTYIPPQFFSRFTAINKICKDKRYENPEIKTQVRFGQDDLEIFTKYKGSEEPYEKVDFTKIHRKRNHPRI